MKGFRTHAAADKFLNKATGDVSIIYKGSRYLAERKKNNWHVKLYWFDLLNEAIGEVNNTMKEVANG